MALLEYANLGYGGPAARAVLSQVFGGLKDFYEFQKRSLDYLKEECVFRVAWKPGEDPKGGQWSRGSRNKRNDKLASWVELVEPDDGPEDVDALFDRFFDEDNSDIYEAQLPPDNGRMRRPPQSQRIKVLRRHRESNQLLLSHQPENPHLLIWPNTRPLERQLDAIRQISNEPRPHHKPLIQLFERADTVRWPMFRPVDIEEEDWFILRDMQRAGTERQREFVTKALATPDFAILEGPPGSGKTTAICELILQLVRRKPNPGRVLLCASTHVAVDNVLERLKDPSAPYAKWINPLRIGDDFNASEDVQDYLPSRRKESDKRRMKEFLRTQPESPARRHLLQGLDEEDLVQRLMLETSNVVCGTTIGILRLFQLMGNGGRSRGSWAGEAFDVLIVDEASKTPFQEFLVPALLAKRWILVGDARQLSPYVDQDALTVNLEACLSPIERNACIDVFLARPDHQPLGRRKRSLVGNQRPTMVVTDDKQEREAYERQAEARDVPLATLGESCTAEVASAGVVLTSPEDAAEHMQQVPLDLCSIRGSEDAVPEDLRRRVNAWLRLTKRTRDQDLSWANQIGYRIVREYEQRFRPGGVMALGDDEETPSRRIERLRQEQALLLPAFKDERSAEEFTEDLDRVRRVALPSILESLQFGFDPSRARNQTALTQGLPRDVFADRHVLLEHQHRMHPEIAAFPCERVYGGRALLTDESMEARRQWDFDQGKPRARWMHVSGPCHGRQSKREAEIVLDQCYRFVKWSRANPHLGDDGTPDGRPWEVGVIVFYRAQERLLRDMLRKETRQHHAYSRFWFNDRQNPFCAIRLCTVDRFQGQEADMILLSIANDHSTVFLESLNRLNVAITRARYQLIIVGNRQAMRQPRAKGTLLHELAHSPLIMTEDLLEK